MNKHLLFFLCIFITLQAHTQITTKGQNPPPPPPPWSCTGTEWSFDPVSQRVYLCPALPQGDSIFYSKTKRKFVFTDLVTPAGGPTDYFDKLNAKYVFRAASADIRQDPMFGLNTSMTEMMMSANGAAPGNVNAMPVKNNTVLTARLNIEPDYQVQSGEQIGVRGIVNNLAGSIVNSITGLQAELSHYGPNRLENMNGLLITTLANGSSGTVGNVFGVDNEITIPGGAGTNSTITGDVYGYYYSGVGGNFNARLQGRAYGLYTGRMNAAANGRNFSIYTNNGTARFGDSMIIASTNNPSDLNPDCELDVRGGGAIAFPGGAPALRPTTPRKAMIRYTTAGDKMEFYNGSYWAMIAETNKDRVTVNTTLNANGGSLLVTKLLSGTNTYSVLDEMAVVNPLFGGLPDGVVITYARVSAPNTVEFKVSNFSAVPVVLTNQQFLVSIVE